MKEIRKGNALIETNFNEIWYCHFEKEVDKRNLSIFEYEYMNGGYVIAIPINESYGFPQIIHLNSIQTIIYFNDILREIEKEEKISVKDKIVPFIGGIPGDDFRDWYKKLIEIADNDDIGIFEMREEIKKHYKNLCLN